MHKSDIWLTVIAPVIFLVAVSAVTTSRYSFDLNNPKSFLNSNDTGVILLDHNDKPFFTLYQTKRKTYIPLSQTSDYLKEAAVASEDKDFYYHNGFSLKAIARSLWDDIESRRLSYGGSTITQQLVKNSLLNSEKDLMRKYEEVVLAEDVEKRFSKGQILEMYLNSVYFGEGAYGAQDAAKAYFGKNAKDLTLAQSALLIALLPAPSKLSPVSGNAAEAKARQEIVLQKMVGQGYITPEQKIQAQNEPLDLKPKNDEMNTIAPHFAMMVKDELVKRYGEDTLKNSGFRVRTTLDLDLQKFAEETVKKDVASLALDGATNGAAVVIDPKTGEILALVGSKDWSDPSFGKVNVVTSPRQSGSAFKPIVYSAAFEKGVITPATVLQDKPTTFAGNYRPQDYDRRFRGPVLARRALANSLNVPSVEVLSRLGVEPAIEMAQRLGITTLTDPQRYGLSLVLGAGEVKLLDLTSVYATFANNGQRNDPTLILEIRDKDDNSIYDYHPNPVQVIDPKIAFLISSILSDSTTRAEVFGNTLDIPPRPAAVKTGTSENFRDALTVGYTPSIAVGVWVGNNNGAPMDNVAGSLGAAPIWKALMEKTLQKTPVEKFDPPEGIVSLSVCKYNGLLAKDKSSASYTEYFLAGTQPTAVCSVPRPTSTPPQNPLSPSPSPPQPSAG